MKKNNITEFDGRGTFTDANTLQVALSDGGEETVTFDHCIIADRRDDPAAARARSSASAW